MKTSFFRSNIIQNPFVTGELRHRPRWGVWDSWDPCKLQIVSHLRLAVLDLLDIHRISSRSDIWIYWISGPTGYPVLPDMVGYPTGYSRISGPTGYPVLPDMVGYPTGYSRISVRKDIRIYHIRICRISGRISYRISGQISYRGRILDIRPDTGYPGYPVGYPRYMKPTGHKSKLENLL